MASRTANVYTRIEPEIKEQAENILNQLGIPMSNAINIFLRQIILHNGMPFEMTLPTKKPISLGSLSESAFDEIIKKSAAEIENGDVISAEEVEKRLQRKYGI